MDSEIPQDTPSDTIDFNIPNVFLFVGIPRSGKSYSIQWLLQKYTVEQPIWKIARIYSGSIGNGDYDFIDEEVVLPYDPEDLHNWRETLRQHTKQHKQEGKEMFGNVIVFDDCLGDLNDDGSFQKLVSTFRHTQTTVIIATQYLATRMTSTNLRSFAEYIFLFDVPNTGALKIYYDNWGNGVSRAVKEIEEYKDMKGIDLFYEMLKTTTDQQYHAMFIERSKMKDIDEGYHDFLCPEYEKQKITFRIQIEPLQIQQEEEKKQDIQKKKKKNPISEMLNDPFF